jgi:hypothetical protein
VLFSHPSPPHLPITPKLYFCVRGRGLLYLFKASFLTSKQVIESAAKYSALIFSGIKFSDTGTFLQVGKTAKIRGPLILKEVKTA